MPPAACRDLPEYTRLDFWVGEWSVYSSKEEKVGTNRISRVLGGCAVVAEWEDGHGRRGMSLFYVNPRERTWKQVWVKEQAARRGGTKEKALTTILPDGGLRFEGELPLPSRVVHDRATLSPLPDGRGRQVIEFSEDGRETWQISFDGMYVRKASR